MFAGVVILGMLMWWWPGYHGWGAMTAGLVGVLVLWIAWRTLAGVRTVPGHPLHAALVVPGAILTVHLLGANIAAAGRGSWQVAGALDMSMILQIALLALAMMLAQSLLPKAARHAAVLGICGASMMGGSAAALVWGETAPVRTSLALIGFGGVGVWLSMLWGLAPPADAPTGQARPGRHRAGRIACVAFGAAAAAGLAVVAPLPALLMAGVVAGTLLLAGLVFHRRRVALLLGGGALAVAVLAALTLVSWVRAAALRIVEQEGGWGWFGRGERAFERVSAVDGGVVLLPATIGWAGAAMLLAAMVAGIVWLLAHARRGHWGDQGRAILWTSAAAAVGCALLAPGGLSIPAATLAAAFAWGLLPAMLSRPERARSGAWLLAAAVGVVLLLGLVRRPGLLLWSTELLPAGLTRGRADLLLHGVTGLVLAMMAAWLAGARRVWLGLAGIAAAALAGGLGELLQRLIGFGRMAELADWACHAAGSAAAIVPYLLCMGARWSESPDARPDQADAAGAYHWP